MSAISVGQWTDRSSTVRGADQFFNLGTVTISQNNLSRVLYDRSLIGGEQAKAGFDIHPCCRGSWDGTYPPGT